MKSAVVRLDDARYGGGPGTVIQFVDTVEEYHDILYKKSDMNKLGGRDPKLRMWRVPDTVSLGDRVSLGGNET